MITFEDFNRVISTIKTQREKDDKLTNVLMDGYLDGINPVPTFSQPSIDMLVDLLAYEFEGSVAFTKDYKYSSWIEWFVYENDFGDKKMQCILNGKEYVISSSKEMYDFLLIWVKSEEENDINSTTETEFPLVNRIEVIDENGRSYVNWNDNNAVKFSLQDDFRTLKIIITKKK